MENAVKISDIGKNRMNIIVGNTNKTVDMAILMRYNRIVSYVTQKISRIFYNYSV